MPQRVDARIIRDFEIVSLAEVQGGRCLRLRTRRVQMLTVYCWRYKSSQRWRRKSMNRITSSANRSGRFSTESRTHGPHPLNIAKRGTTSTCGSEARIRTGRLHARSPNISFNLVLSAISAGDPAGRRSHESNIFLVSRALGAGLSGFHREFVQALRFVFYVLATAGTINRQPHGLVERPRFHFDGVLNSVRRP
jgi:hypothetical protein